jgi:hypothetical protein
MKNKKLKKFSKFINKNVKMIKNGKINENLNHKNSGYIIDISKYE